MFFKPSHPGALVKENIVGLELEGIDLTIQEIADNLGVTRKTLSSLINEKQGISNEMAYRLAAAFTNTDAEFWMNIQRQYDISQLDIKSITKDIKKIW